MTSKQCETCKKNFSVIKSREEKARFCSYLCYWGFTKSQTPPSHIVCTKCGVPKEFRFFHKSRQGAYGRKSYCSTCAHKFFNNWKVKNYEKINKYRKQRYSQIIKTPKFIFERLKRNAKQRNILFNIDLDFFMSLWDKECTYCGDIVTTAGIDRVDSSIGYVKENCVRCCSVCNKAKNNMSIEQFINHCKKILNKYAINS
jgi:hypothetical protein